MRIRKKEEDELSCERRDEEENISAVKVCIINFQSLSKLQYNSHNPFPACFFAGQCPPSVHFVSMSMSSYHRNFHLFPSWISILSNVTVNHSVFKGPLFVTVEKKSWQCYLHLDLHKICPLSRVKRLSLDPHSCLRDDWFLSLPLTTCWWPRSPKTFTLKKKEKRSGEDVASERRTWDVKFMQKVKVWCHRNREEIMSKNCREKRGKERERPKFSHHETIFFFISSLRLSVLRFVGFCRLILQLKIFTSITCEDTYFSHVIVIL